MTISASLKKKAPPILFGKNHAPADSFISTNEGMNEGRDICFRSQRRPTRQGAIDAAAAVEKTDQAPARTATAKPDARRTIAQTWRGQERGGQGLCAAGHLHADEGSAGHIRNIPLRTRPEEIAAGPAARRRLFAALQYQER